MVWSLFGFNLSHSAMDRLVYVLLLVVWLVGAITAGLMVHSGPPDDTAHSERVTLTVEHEQVTLTVRLPGHAPQQLAAPVPSFFASWLYEAEDARLPRKASDQDELLVTPFHIFSPLLL